ncbi:MAG: ABC transporter permease [Acidobacteriia bacterium]|nr:ABC transporter permease [Terriglobia bacterium]
MNVLIQDLRYAVRQLRKIPVFTAVAVVTLALGIGANTAIFSLINSIMLRTLPIKNPQSLVLLKWKARRIPDTTASLAYDNCTHGGGFWNGRALISQAPLEPDGCSFSFPLFQELQEKSSTFSSVVAFVPLPAELAVNSGGKTSHARVLLVSGNFFSVLGAHPALGRLIAPTDDSDTAKPAIAVSHRFWQNELGQDPSVLGKDVLVGKTLFTVIGITGGDFPELDPGLPSDIWLPMAFQAAVEPRLPKKTDAKALWVELMARLRPGISIMQSASAASVLFAAATTNGPDAMFRPDDSPRVTLSSSAHGLVTLRQNFSQPLFALFAAVALVLLISCANIAGLTLARSKARQKELAMRVALGATWGRILRQLLTESVLLSVAGGAIGILLGDLGASALAGFLSHNWYLPVKVDVRPDAHVLVFTALVSILTGIAFGLAPASSSKRPELIPALKQTSGTAPGTPGRPISLGSALVVVQVALAMLVLAGTTLLVRTLSNLKAENIGFDPQNLVVFQVDASYSKRSGENLQTLYSDVQGRLSSLPGVISASRSGVLLLSGGGMGGEIFSKDQSGRPIHVGVLPVAGNFFQTMGIRLLEGRTLSAQDSGPPSNSVPTRVVVNQALARRLFGAENPLGSHFRENEDGPEDEIVGVVADTKYANVRDEIQPTIYNSIGNWDADFYFEVRTAMDSKAMMPGIRDAVTRFDSNLLVTGMKTQAEQIDQNIYQEQLIANLSTLFAVLALIVTCVGIYGLLSYQVSMRTREIGIRLALGAQRGDVLRLVIRQGALISGSGVLVGFIAVLAVTRYLQSFLFGVKPSDPTTIAAAAFGLIAVALLACYIPARRAMQTDPNIALHYE